LENARDLERQLSRSFTADHDSSFAQPQVLIPVQSTSLQEAANILESFRAQSKIIRDLFDEMLMELMLVRHPQYKKDQGRLEERYRHYKQAYLDDKPADLAGSWVLYGNGTLLHLLLPTDHYELRTSRNIGLLTNQEQQVFANAHIAVGGLSVGGRCATTLAMEGINSFFITDFDRLACSNLNRISSSLSNVGIEKTDIVAQKIWDIDPFARVELDSEGFAASHAQRMFNPDRLPDVVIEAMDSMDAKIEAREACRKHRIPLVWMIDMGDGVVQIGTERYDLDPHYPAFHGNLERMKQQVGRELSYVECCFSIFNHDFLPYRMADSFLRACNNEGAGISQLAGTVAIAAGAISKVVRKILLGESVIPEFFIDVNEKADPGYTEKRQQDRQQTHDLMKALSLR